MIKDTLDPRLSTPSKPAPGRRAVLGGGVALGAGLALPFARPARADGDPFHIYRVTFRGRTEVEDGFDDYLAAQAVPVRFTERDANRDRSTLPGFVEEIRDLKPNLVVTWGTSVTLGIVGRYDSDTPQNHIRDIPTVFALVSAPVASGVVPSRTEKERPVTGAVHIVPTETQMRAMAAYAPYDKVGVIYTSTASNSQVIFQSLRDLQEPLGFELIERTFAMDSNGQPTDENFEEMVADIKRQGADWLFLPTDVYLGSLFDRLKVIAAEVKLPTFGTAERAIRDGAALVGLVSRYYSVGQLAAFKAKQILVDGQSAAEIPIETLKRFSLIVNMPMAKQLSLYPPLDMLSYAEVLTEQA